MPRTYVLRCVALLFATASTLAPASAAVAAPAPFCAAGRTPQFVLGFRALADALGDTMGNPVECEHANPANGDTLQKTTAGLGFYRKATNTATFTTGFEHWALVGGLVVYWTGESVDPPATAAPNSGSPELDLINAYRAAAGAPPARLVPSLAQAAAAHVAYYDANHTDGSMVGMGLHQEAPGAPGFTGISMGDRARAAGYGSGAVTENAGFGDLGRAVGWYMHTVNHRLPLIHPSARDIGFAVSDSTGFGIVDVGLRRDTLTTPLPSVYPGEGATDVPTSWDGAETPDPAPGTPRPLGYPITVAFGVYQQVQWNTFELRAPGGEPLEITSPRTDWMRAAAIVPLRPLDPGQTYTAHVEAIVDGKPLSKDWRFMTRS